MDVRSVTRCHQVALRGAVAGQVMLAPYASLAEYSYS